MEINKLIAEELEKFKLFTKYSPEKTLTENENFSSEELKEQFDVFGDIDRINQEQSIANSIKPTTQTKKPNTTSPERQKYINSLYCSVKGGVIDNKDSGYNKVSWDEFVKFQNITNQEIETAKKSCPNRDIPSAFSAPTATTAANTATTASSTGTTAANTAAQTKLKFIPEKFPLRPLKYMDQGPNVKRLQGALDVRNKAGKLNITGKFYNATQAALYKRAKELGLSYDSKIGLTKDDFDKIMAAREKFSSGGATDFDDYGILSKKYQQQNVQTNNIERRPEDMPGEPKNPETEVKDDDVNSTGY